MGLLPPFSRKLRVESHDGLIKFSLFCHAGADVKRTQRRPPSGPWAIAFFVKEEWYAGGGHMAM